MSDAVELPERARELVAEGAVWHVAATLLERPRPGWTAGVEPVAAEARNDRLMAATAAAQEATEEAYLALLGPGGKVSPREVAYRGRSDPGHVLADLAGFYRAFSFHPRAEDPADHIAVEAGFVGYLLLKEACAVATGDTAAAEITADGRARFLEDHLRRFLPKFAARLFEKTNGYLRTATQVMLEGLGEAPCPPGDEDESPVEPWASDDSCLSSP